MTSGFVACANTASASFQTGRRGIRRSIDKVPVGLIIARTFQPMTTAACSSSVPGSGLSQHGERRAVCGHDIESDSSVETHGRVA